MTSKEFVTWMQGFVEACHEYAPTPKQWDALKDKLKEVDDSIPLGGIISDHNTFRVSTTLGYPSGSSISYTTSNK